MVNNEVRKEKNEKEPKFFYLYLAICYFIFAIIVLIMWLYFDQFDSGLSTIHADWGVAGSFFGGTLGPLLSLLAFVGLLFNISRNKQETMLQISKSEKQFEIQRVDNNFYSLLELHVNKITHMEFENKRGYEVFKELNKKYDNEFKEIMFYYFKDVLSKKLRENNISDLNQAVKGYIFKSNLMDISSEESLIEHYNKYKTGSQFNSPSYSGYYLEHEYIKSLVDNSDLECKDKFIAAGIYFFEKESFENKLEIFKRCYEVFYDQYGYLVGNYFRNFYYILSYIDSIKVKEIKYDAIYRAQLSRFEISLLFYNCLSEYSSESFNELLIKYNYFNGLYCSDLCYYPTTEQLEQDLLEFSNLYKK
ncbi:putative phage abortive infection protein [Providencia vermicola]|uniref:putative phage abortive infection protein n=1 Tax=Providencia vermicola TaxID=333965 RepID=UPI0032DA04D6